MTASSMPLAATVSSSNAAGIGSLRARKIRTSRKAWVAWDVFSVVLSAGLATFYRLHTSPGQGLRELIHGTLIQGRSMGTLLAYLAGFTLALVLINRGQHNRGHDDQAGNVIGMNEIERSGQQQPCTQASLQAEALLVKKTVEQSGMV